MTSSISMQLSGVSLVEELTEMGLAIRERLDEEIAQLNRLNRRIPRRFEFSISIKSNRFMDTTVLKVKTNATPEELQRAYRDAKAHSSRIPLRRQKGRS